MSFNEEELNKLRASVDMAENNGVTLANVNTMADSLARLRDLKKVQEESLSKLSAEIETLNQRIIDILVENGLTSYKAPAGTLSVSHIFTAKLPQGEDKVKCFEYLREIGRFDDMASIHSATFNSWVKEQYELAQERGEDEPKLPGVNDVKTLLRISFRKR